MAVVATAMWMAATASTLAPALLTAILVVDLLSALPYDIKPDGIEFYAMSESETHPSVHALAIGRALEPTQGRALALGGTQVDDVLPATFARVWRIPIAGGYGPMLMDRLSRMATMGTNGEVRPTALADEDATLDLLAVRYVIVNERQLDDPVRQRWLKGSGRWQEAMHFGRRDRRTRSRYQVEGERTSPSQNRRELPRAGSSPISRLEDRDGISMSYARRGCLGRVSNPGQRHRGSGESSPQSTFRQGPRRRVLALATGISRLLYPTGEGLSCSANWYGMARGYRGAEVPI